MRSLYLLECILDRDLWIVSSRYGFVYGSSASHWRKTPSGQFYTIMMGLSSVSSSLYLRSVLICTPSVKSNKSLPLTLHSIFLRIKLRWLLPYFKPVLQFSVVCLSSSFIILLDFFFPFFCLTNCKDFCYSCAPFCLHPSMPDTYFEFYTNLELYAGAGTTWSVHREWVSMRQKLLDKAQFLGHKWSTSAGTAVVHLGLCSKRLWYESTFNCCHGVFMLKMRYMGMANYTRYSVITERKLQSYLPESWKSHVLSHCVEQNQIDS